jgi:NAD(P)-dependent dehydrogenase (short-subunit alcohol dehydrogenase family)
MERTAIVTGGTGGLGAAVVKRLLDDGWRVVVPWVVESELERVERQLDDSGAAQPDDSGAAHSGEAGGRAGGGPEGEAGRRAGRWPEALELINADLFDPAGVAAVVSLAVAGSGAPLHGVVNLVGGFAAGGRVHETPIDEFERQFRLNLRPTYLVTQAAIPHMLEHGGGSIVCVGTRAALQPFPGAAGYIASKAAVIAFSQAVAVEYRNDGIRCNTILPSVIDTPANRASMPNADHDRWVKPAEIAGVIAHLLSRDSTPVSGAAVPVYGRA